jgi:hypothetical protein
LAKCPQSYDLSLGAEDTRIQGGSSAGASVGDQARENRAFCTLQNNLSSGIGNDICALALVKQAEEIATPTPPIIAEVLQEFQDIFTDLTALPPHRVYDHIIPLLPGAVPVNARPYRYSPLHKDEFEW